MKKYIHLTLVLFIIASLSGFILGIVNDYTKEPIALAEAKKLSDGIEDIFPNLNKEALKEEESKVKIGDKVLKEYYIIYDSNEEIIGYVFYVIGPDAYKRLEFIVGIDTNGKVKGISYLASEETPGVGTKVYNKDFINRFIGLNDVKDVDTLTGATKSSKAVKNGINNALKYYNEKLAEKEVVNDEN